MNSMKNTGLYKREPEQEHLISRPLAISYQELMNRCQEKEGFSAFQKEREQVAYQEFLKGVSYQTISIHQIQSYLDFLGDKDPLVVIGFAPPYYPSMNCRSLPKTSLKIGILVDDYRRYLEKRGQSLKVEEYFMGIVILVTVPWKGCFHLSSRAG